MTERQREIKWPEKLFCNRHNNIGDTPRGMEHCGSCIVIDSWNGAIDACRKSYVEAQIVGLVPINSGDLTELLYKVNPNCGARIRKEYVTRIISTFGTQQSNLVPITKEEFINALCVFHDGNPNQWFSRLERIWDDKFSKFGSPAVPSVDEIEHCGLTALLNDKSVICPVRKQLSIVSAAIHRLLTNGKEGK